MGKDEQVEEREVLDSIFPEEIQDLTDGEFRISILLDVTNDPDDESEPPTLLLQVKYPDEYPDVAPSLDILGPPNAPSHPYFSVSSDKQQLLDGLTETVEENIGMAMIFTIVSTLKDNAEQLVAERQASNRREEEKRLEEVERQENAKFQGEAVTVESFLQWREKFQKEMEERRIRDEEVEEAAEKKRNKGKEAAIPLTGKQLWERGLAGKVEEEEDDDDEEDGISSERVDKLKISA